MGKRRRDIFLTGPKHAGKTCAGRELAALCSCEFIDLDELILSRTGKTPRQLYTESREIFQKAEAEALASLAARPGFHLHRLRVVATGGGIIDNNEAVSFLERQRDNDAVIVYLHITADSAWCRISASGELPPFLQTDNPRETHRVLHDRRAAAYLKIAELVIQTEGKSPREIAEEVLAFVNS